MAVLLESEVDGEPFSCTFFSASGSDPWVRLLLLTASAGARAPTRHQLLIVGFTSTIKKCGLSLTYLY